MAARTAWRGPRDGQCAPGRLHQRRGAALEQVGLGFAGLGWLGESLVKALSHFPRLRLAAVQDADPELAAAVAARHGSPRHGTDYEALVATPDVDVVVICTPNWLHVEQARAALLASKHVLVQKPLALSPVDARETVDLAARVGRLLVVDYSYRYLETIRSLRVALPDIGRVERVMATFHNIYGPSNRWPFEPRLSGGGALIDLGVHLLDLGLDALRPRRVRLESAERSFARGYRVEDAARILVRLDDVPMSVEVSWNADRPLADISLQVDGERGRLRWENVDGSFVHFRSLRDGALLLDRETTLRADTLEVLDRALRHGVAPPIHLEVYDLLAEAYASTDRRIMGPAPGP